MRRFSLRAFAFAILVCLPVFSQENVVVRIGVAVLRSGTNKVSATEARDRLVKALNHKRGKNQGIAVEAFALKESEPSKALAEAKEKKYEFLLSSHLTDLQTSEKSQATDMLGSTSVVPVITAKVVYELTRVMDGAPYAIGSVTSDEQSSIPDAVLQAMGEVGAKAMVGLKKGGNVPRSEAAAVAESAATVAQPLEARLIGTDYCKWLPTDMAHADAVHGVCEYAMSLQQRMPNFICDQETARYRGENGVPRDLITALVRYEEGNESYSEIKLNGKVAPSAVTGSAGLWSTGEFGNNLRAIFDLNNHALFEFAGEKTLGVHGAWVFKYRIVKQNDPLWRLRTEDEMVAPAYEGELWVDEKSGDLLRFRAVADDIPVSFPTQSAELLTDYDKVDFADGTGFVLPAEATVATKFRKEEATRNVLRFRNCRKFRARARIVTDLSAGGAGENAAASEATKAAERALEVEQNETIYAILREQAVREDEARLEMERQQELGQSNFQVVSKLAELEKTRRQEMAARAKEAEAAAAVAGSTLARSGEGTGAGAAGLETIKVRVNLVQVSVVPRDPKGQAVGNLRQEDFQLFDNGKPQVITRFSAQKAKSEPASEAGASLEEGRKTESAGRRYLAYVFDDIHTSFADLASAREAAARHLAALRSEDWAGVFTTSGQVGLDFTDDRAKLEGALKSLRPHPIAQGVRCPAMSAYMADLIVNQDDLESLSVATTDAVNCAFGGIKDSVTLRRAEQQAKSTAFEVMSASSAETQSTFGVLREVVRRTAAAPGNRSIVLISPGFLLLSPGTRESMMELTDQALRSDIVVHTLDVRGLPAPMGAANSMHSSAPVSQFRYDKEQETGQSEVMSELAYSTGGTYFHNNNDLNEGFRRTADAPEFIYVLGFSPQKLDGKFHKLRVKLSGGEKLTIQARQGYYALKPAAQ